MLSKKRFPRVLYEHKSKVVIAAENFHLESFRWEMREEPSTSRVKEYYNNSTVWDFLEEEAERGNAKGSREAISLAEKEGRAAEEDLSSENK